jgi:xylulokinase
MNSFIGIDIGTTGIRAGVYAEDFRLLGTGQGRSLIRKGPGGEIFQEADEMYGETAAAVKAALENAGIDPGSVACISFDGQMAGVMAVDEEWNAVIPYDSWLDTRCGEQVRRIQSRAGRRVMMKTGNIPSYNHGPKILWWKENRPELYRKVRAFIQPGAYVAGRLCGLRGSRAFIDWTYLHFSGFADSKGLRWDEELTDLLGVDREKLPAILSPLTLVGKVQAPGAELFGLLQGTPVAAGCGDTASCFLGTGAVEPGIAVDVAGTASVFSLTTDRFMNDPSGTVYAARSVIKDIWYSMSYINGGGMNLEWFRDSFARDRSFAQLDDEARDVPPGSGGLLFIPHLEGRAYPSVPGMRGQWRGFTRSHGIAHFYRSILEGTAYEYALYRDRMESILDEKLSFSIRGVGGGAASDLWDQIKSDVLNMEYCTINRDDIGILGQALIAASAVRHVDDPASAVRRIVRIEKTFRPSPGQAASYESLVRSYRRMLEEEGGPSAEPD